MTRRTSVTQRIEFYRLHLSGKSYLIIAEDMGVSKECVRYWCRRQRDGGDVYNRYRRKSPGLLSQFDAKVRYVVLRLRLEHPRWGPRSILFKMGKRVSLRGLRLPSKTQIGRYLRQWSRFRRRKRPTKSRERHKQPTAVHQRWQLDFKTGIALQDGTLVNLHTVRDPFGGVCIGAYIYPTGQVGDAPKGVTLKQVQRTLRLCYARWGTLPQEMQTDGENNLAAQRRFNDFPTRFTLWLKGLNIEHLIIRPGRPTDNAEVERCHRTINDYAIVGNEKFNIQDLQTILNQAVDELAFELPSKAKGCNGRPPVEAHPELLQQPRPFSSEWELAFFDMQRVDVFLASRTWTRLASKNGQIFLGAQRYSIGRAHARKDILIRFGPNNRQLVFFDLEQPEFEIKRWAVKGLKVTDLTGKINGSGNLTPQQLPLPFNRA